MTTAAELRNAIERCAHDALRLEGYDTGQRARSFIARLSGAMHAHGEHALERVLDELAGLPPSEDNTRTAPTTTDTGAQC